MRGLSLVVLAFFGAAAAAASVEAPPMSLVVAIEDMRTASRDAIAARAATQSRDGVVIVFEGVDSARAEEVVRAAAADAIAHGYKVNGAILAAVESEPRVLIYGVEGAAFGPAIAVTDLLEKHVTARAHELGITRLGGVAAQTAAAAGASTGEAGDTAAAAGERKKCRVERTTGSRVRQTRYCVSDKESRAQRDALQNTQDRGASNPDPDMGGG